MSNVLILTSDVIRDRMAGPAIRAWHIASELSKAHSVRLVSTSPTQSDKASDGFAVLSARLDGDLRVHTKWADVLIIQGQILTEYPWMLRLRVPIVADVYDPMHLELLEQTKALPAGRRAGIVRAITNTLDVQLERADFLLCASTKQRDFWLGQLAANGRINPRTYDADPSLHSLITVVPFGVGDEPPRATRHAIIDTVPGITAGDDVILWGGGIYDWFDPITLVRAMPAVVAAHPRAKLFFMGSGHPNPAVPNMRVAGEARELAEELGLLNSTVFFNDEWVAFDDRVNFLRDARIGVSTHPVHLETEFSFRTRVLDYLWAGLPMVLTEGDGFADLVSARGLGAVVPEADADALASALLALLEDHARYDACAEQVVRVAEEFRWSRVLEPLVAFCDAPRFAADHQGTVGRFRAAFWRFGFSVVRHNRAFLPVRRGLSRALRRNSRR